MHAELEFFPFHVHEGLAAVLLQEAGVTHIWLPPPSQSVAAQGYLPGQLYNLDSKYGNKEELQALCKELKAAGIMPLADIVINHRCADEKGEDGVYNTFRSAHIQYAALLHSVPLFLLLASNKTVTDLLKSSHECFKFVKT